MKSSRRLRGPSGSSRDRHPRRRCRGNVGAALRCWRERLRTEPEADGPMEEAGEADAGRDRTSEQSVWVAAASPEPVLPAGDGEEAALVLHAALVHGGLPESLLHELLPMSPSRCRSLALRLRDAGFLRSGGEGGRWDGQAPGLCGGQGHASRTGLSRGRFLTMEAACRLAKGLSMSSGR